MKIRLIDFTHSTLAHARSRVLLVCLLSILFSCVPKTNTISTSDSTSNKINSTNNGNTPGRSTSATVDQSPLGEPTKDLYWYSNHTIANETLTINADMLSVVYLRGNKVEEFLNSAGMDQSYCLVTTYAEDNAKKQMRLRTVPINYNNLSLGRVEKILRVDVPNKSLNESFCQGTVDGISTSTDMAFSPAEMCPTCLRTFNSKSVKLFKSSGEAITEEVPSELFLLSSLSIRVDPTNASTSNASECNDTLCSSKGYDCCLNGQCVNDGETKPNAIEHPEYFQSRIDIKNNLLNFTKYPEIYYVCSNIIRETVEDNSTTSGECSDPSINTKQECEASDETFTSTTEIANQTFEQYKKEYFCLLEGEKENPNYALGSCSLIEYVGETSCTNAGGTWTRFCYPSGSEEDFINIRANVWDRCGCEADPFSTSPEDNPCPDFGLRATKNTAGEILEITCRVPLDVVDPPIFQELNIDVPTRAAPHRFFIDYVGDSGDYKGENFDELTLHLSDFQQKQIGTQVEDIIEKKLGAPSPSLSKVVPQGFGDNFGYADNANKRDFLGADNFNYNAIFGQFNVQLSGAKPASVVYVEFGQNYIIRAKEGRYEPCVMCDIDSWFDNFSAHPPSTQGRGLEAVGFTASRDNYVSNITMGNYEDTIFGRACWVPLTMIPMSHLNLDDVISNASASNRSRRLMAQTALYVNGYQRDWFGFNKGALIGSFDGVRWFAIGGGRRVTAKSSKLYLAINGAFSDLVTPGSISVSILTDNGINVASDQDFDPNLSEEDARVESGASCQKYHQCEHDADCVTQLGWEYMCADVSQYRTAVPEFDFHANEKAGEQNKEKISIGMGGFLHNAMPSGSKKRCVYRGAGSICKRNYTDLNRFEDTDSERGSANPTNRAKINRQKLITCAPNFYCAKFSDNDFNDQVVRNVSNNSLILYGQDADVLGRPLNYVGGGKSINSSSYFLLPLTSNYDASIQSYYSDENDYRRNGIGGNTSTVENLFQWGVCRPGKSQASHSYLEQHKDKDNLRRSDYVSQVGACDPEETGMDRVLACPIFDMRPFIDDKATKPNGNFLDYIFYSDETPISVDGNIVTTFDSSGWIRLTQNACGKEAQFDPDGTGVISIYKDIENPNNPSSFLVPGLSEVSCMRRAGAVCHTDLECSPNKFHAEVAETYGVEAFGGTMAEKEYWEQYLVCGQKDRPPHVSGLNFDSYDLRKNRCCREVGKEITMHTYSSDEDAGTLGYLTTYDPILSQTSMTSDDPTLEGRYSRYGKNERTLLSEIPTIEKTSDQVDAFISAVPGKTQWKIFQETGRNTCCGNGFVRKFADGTNNWSNRNRLNIPPESFTCLNYRNEFAEAMKDEAVKNRLFDEDLRQTFDIDQNMYCLSPHEGQSSGWGEFPGQKIIGNGCPQISLAGDDPDSYDDPTPPQDIGIWNSASIEIRNYLQPIVYETGDRDSYEQFPLGVTNPHLTIDTPFFPIGFDESTEIAEIIFAPDLRELATAIWPIPYALPYAECTQDDGCVHKYSSWGAAFILPSYIRTKDIQAARILYRDEHENQSETIIDPATGMASCPADPYPGDLGNYPQFGGGPEYMCSKEHNGQQIIVFRGVNTKCNGGDGACVDVSLKLWFRPANGTSSRYYATDDINCHDDLAETREATFNFDWNKCAGLIPGSPYFYLEKFARFELLGIPQIDYEPVICNSNREKIVPGLFKDSEGNDINLVHGKEASIGCNSDGFCDIDNGWASTPSDYQGISGINGSDTYWLHDNLTTVLKDNVKMPDIFSENEFLCCVKLGETTESASNCCSGHAIYTTPGDPTKGMTCRLPYGADLNVYFNRFVSSDGLLEDSKIREDKEPVGFTLDQFDPRTGEVIPSEETDAILQKLGEKYCTGDSNNDARYSDDIGHRVRRGSAVGNFQAGPTSFYYLGYQHPDHETNMNSGGVDQNYLRMGFVDHYMDGEPAASNSNLDFDRGYYPYQSGYRWNHHFYCTGAPGN